MPPSADCLQGQNQHSYGNQIAAAQIEIIHTMDLVLVGLHQEMENLGVCPPHPAPCGGHGGMVD